MNSSEDLSVIDVISYITEELQTNYRNASNKEKLFRDFLMHWEADDSIAKAKSLHIEFDTDLDWFNVSRPLSLQSLSGKIVVLDFFTYCCINCMHVLPELRKLEQEFPVESGLVVIGVHSPKFENERIAANILSAAQRYGIEHPIVNDSRSALWKKIGIRCWPSLLVLNPMGLPVLLLMGEGHANFLKDFVKFALPFYTQQGQINTSNLPIRLTKNFQLASNLRFPAKISRSPQGRFVIADAGNHRMLVISNEGVVQHKIGGNEAGFIDGDFFTARFNHPQGVAFMDEDTIIVADTENHALRKIVLKESLVETLVGTGQQGQDRIGGCQGMNQSISSPWDVAVFRTRDMDMSFHLDERNVQEKTIILIAMAGLHQIWGYFPEGIIWWKFRTFEPGCCASLIGNGLEENRNNSYPQNAAFAQPSGLAICKDNLIIADSESSSIRKASMLDGKVTRVVGGDRNPLNLFAFGDMDGKSFNAKLQHPLGLACNHTNGNQIYVADTYNHKVKVIDLDNNFITTLNIKNVDGDTLIFNEPAGLCVDASGQNLLVSDTNNHVIYTINLNTLIARQFPLDFSQLEYHTETDAPQNPIQLVKHAPILSYRKSSINFSILLSKEFTFTNEAPQKWTLQSMNPRLVMKLKNGMISKDGQFVVHLLLESTNAAKYHEKDVVLELALNLCNANSCLMKRFLIAISDPKEDTVQVIANDDSLSVDVKIQIDGTKIRVV